MFNHKALDQRPGVVPDIRADGDSVLYCLDIMPWEDVRLIIRCDPDGTVRASIIANRRIESPT